MSATLDNINSLMCPATNSWASSIDYLSDKRGGQLMSRLVGPMLAIAALADAVCHLTACIFKTAYSGITGTIEVLYNAFTIRWQTIDPFGAPSWNRGEAARHLVKSVSYAAFGLLLTPVSLAMPAWGVDGMRFLRLAAPAKSKPKVEEEKKPPTFSEKMEQVVKKAMKLSRGPFEMGYYILTDRALRSLATDAIAAVAVGVAAVGAAHYFKYIHVTFPQTQ